MKSIRRVVASWVAACVISIVAAFNTSLAWAHHSFGAFEMDRLVTYQGTIVDYKLMNPHSHFTLKVAPGASDPAKAGIWDVEGASLNIMMRQGWKKNTLKPGDMVTVIAHPLRDGAKGMALFYVQLPDGTRLYRDIARPKVGQ